MARGAESGLEGVRDGAELELPQLDALASEVLSRLTDAGHEAAIVGGSLRDVLRGTAPHDWDVATSAHPNQVVRLFPSATWRNRFGTVTVHAAGPGARGDGGPGTAAGATGRAGWQAQVTTFRTEGGYRDRRRPDEVSFGASLAEDLARRDFTVNAMAWVPTAIAARRGSLIDPYGGVADLRAGILRAVGDPDERLTEDALRLLRAVRFAHALELRLDPATEAAIRRHAALAASVSGERLRDELLRIVGADRPPPSGAFRLMERLGLLSVVLPELAALRGIPQAKRIPGDALDHTLRALDAAEAGDTTLRLAALLHDTGKADTLAGGHFYGHEKLGAERTRGVLERLRIPRTEIEAIVAAVRHHMFAYAPEWTDAAVRRFVRRVGRRRIPLLLALRRADNVASGVEEPNLGGLTELEARVAAVSEAPLGREELAIDGHDLQRELGVAAGPGLGRLLDRLMEAVIDDPSLNDRHRLLELAREELAPG